jgi:TfoX/Sxy family transcriptional regulator of competence genes
MSYDEKLAERTRAVLDSRDDVVEKKMFGGLAFLVHGHMCVGIVDRELMVRVGPDAYESALAQAHAKPMDFTGQPLRGMVYVGTAGLRSEAALRAWVDRGLRFVSALAPKTKAAAPKRRRTNAAAPKRRGAKR